MPQPIQEFRSVAIRWKKRRVMTASRWRLISRTSSHFFLSFSSVLLHQKVFFFSHCAHLSAGPNWVDFEVQKMLPLRGHCTNARISRLFSIARSHQRRNLFLIAQVRMSRKKRKKRKKSQMDFFFPTIFLAAGLTHLPERFLAPQGDLDSNRIRYRSRQFLLQLKRRS